MNPLLKTAHVLKLLEFSSKHGRKSKLGGRTFYDDFVFQEIASGCHQCRRFYHFIGWQLVVMTDMSFNRDIQTIFARLERKNYLIFALALRIEVLSHRANQFTSVLKYCYIMENNYQLRNHKCVMTGTSFIPRKTITFLSELATYEISYFVLIYARGNDLCI